MMRGWALVVAVLATALAVSEAVIYPFPYSKCITSPSAYTLEPAVRTPKNNTFCFTVKVAIPDACTSYCCKKADLRKVAIDVKPECKVKNPRITATVNGVLARTTPSIEHAPDGPEDAYYLRLTQLGLNLTTANGAEICITLGANSAGAGCVNMQQLCKPPPGAKPGTCNTALYDSQFDCCPTQTIPGDEQPSTPPPMSPAVPSARPCKACASLRLDQFAPTYYTVSLTQAQCLKWQNMVTSEVIAQAAAVGATIVSSLPPNASCTTDLLEVCFTFASDEDGAKLQGWIESQLLYWYSETVDPCKTYYRGPYQVGSLVSNGVDDSGCLNARVAIACDPPFVDFPNCKCNTDPGATPFYALPFLEVARGRTNNTSLYCFQVLVRDAWDRTSACGQTNNLLKAEVYADDTRRRKLKGLAVQPAGATSLRYVPASWGPTGDNTLKFTSLNWSKEQANGAKLCMEVDDSFGVGPLCFSGATETCKVVFFDTSKDCCPMFDAST